MVALSRHNCVGGAVNGKWSMSIHRLSTVFAGDLDANQGALERHTHAIPVNIWIFLGEALLGPGLLRLRALQINLGGELGGFREHGYSVGQNFREAAN